MNQEILFQLLEKGFTGSSNTMLNGNFAIRVAITNHRSKKEDFDVLVNSVLDIARSIIT